VIAREMKLVREENLAAAAGTPVSALSGLLAHLQPVNKDTQNR
jgi:hypothetical protein